MGKVIVAVGCFLTLLASVYAATVYQYTDENGDVVFSDTPRPGARKLEVKPATPVTSPKPAKKAAESIAPVAKPSAEKTPEFAGYTTAKILSPSDDSTFNAGDGVVNIQVDLEPPLQLTLGHRIVIELDGQWQPDTWQSTVVTIKNVDRGTHQVKAMVLDKNAKVVKSTAAITFHLHRPSRLFN